MGNFLFLWIAGIVATLIFSSEIAGIIAVAVLVLVVSIYTILPEKQEEKMNELDMF